MVTYQYYYSYYWCNIQVFIFFVLIFFCILVCIHYNESSVYSEELNDLYSSPNIIPVIKWRRMRWTGHVGHMGVGRVAYRVSVWKPEEKSSLGRPRRRLGYNIKMEIQEMGSEASAVFIWLRIGTDEGHL